MQDVLEDRSTAATGYVVFCFQVVIYIITNHSANKLRNKMIIPLTVTDISRSFAYGLYCTKSTKGTSIDIVRS